MKFFEVKLNWSMFNKKNFKSFLWLSGQLKITSKNLQFFFLIWIFKIYKLVINNACISIKIARTFTARYCNVVVFYQNILLKFTHSSTMYKLGHSITVLFWVKIWVRFMQRLFENLPKFKIFSFFSLVK